MIAINVGWALVFSMLASSAIEEIGVSGWVLPVVLLVLGAVAVVFVPELRHRRWRYEIRDDEIDIRHGTFTVRRTLIPIRRIQHVDTEAGLIQSMFDVAAVKFHTAAGASTIPAVDKGEADAIRRRVSDMTRTRDDV